MEHFVLSEKQIDLLEANQKNYCSYIRAYSAVKNATLLEKDNLLMLLSEVDGVFMLYNCVVPSKQSESEIDQILERYKSAGRPVMCVVFPGTNSSRIGKYLKEDKSMMLFRLALMHVDLSNFNSCQKLPDGVSIRRVADREMFEEWATLVALSYELTNDIKRAMIEEQSRLFLDPNIRAKHYLAFFRGRPVGTSTVFISDGVAGIYNITTAPEARGMGIGKALTELVMLEGKKNHCDFALNQATAKGQPLYEKMGWITNGMLDIYVKMYGKSKIILPLNLVSKKLARLNRKLFFRVE